MKKKVSNLQLVQIIGFVFYNYLSGNETTNLHRYIWANYNQFANRPQVAQEWYGEILKSQPSLYSYKGYINFLYNIGKFKVIVSMMPAFDESFKNDPEIQLIFARSLEHVGATRQADDKIIRLNNDFKTNQEIAFQAANTYLRRKEPENAIKAIDDLLNNSPRKPNNFIFHFLKAQIYNNLNQKQEALKSIKTVLELQKNFDKAWLFYALLEEEYGELDQAIKGFTHFLELTGQNKEIEQHLLQLMFKQKIAQQKPNSFALNKTCFEQALSFFDRKQYASAFSQIELCLQTMPQNKEARLLKIEILAAQHHFAQAAQAIKSWILEDCHNPYWYKALHLLCKSGLPHQKAIAVLEDIHQQQQGTIWPLLYLADLHFRTHMLETSLMYHKIAVDLAQDPLLKTKILFQMSLIHYQMKQFDLMEQLLEKGLQLRTEFPPLLNLLAYHYATTGKGLAQAQQLMDTVFQQHKKNPYYLDTQAFIYYQQKKYDKALNILKLISEQIPNNELVWKHLAQVYYELGEIKQAKLTLEKALQLVTNDYEKNECNTLLEKWNKLQ